jgi:tRNA (mo5U34)-methyltransferase
MSQQGATPDQLRSAIAEHDWYHTIELAPGVVTPGWMDTRAIARELPWPSSLAGKRCLDVATFDGAWALEMARRGADEVIAIDVLDPEQWDWPAGTERSIVEIMASRKAAGSGFELVMAATGSNVARHELSVHDLAGADLGEFDLVYVGSLLLHLRDPVGALMRVRDVCRGHMLLVDAYDPGLTRLSPRRPVARLDGVGRPWWWKPNLATLVRMVEAAGFELLGKPHRFRMPAGEGQPAARVSPAILLHAGARGAWLGARYGDPHAAILARPRPSS